MDGELRPEVLRTFAFLMGLLVGSFLNVVIHRVPRGESVVHPRSSCPGCGQLIAAWHNIPLLSWLWLRGRCAGCRARISIRYPAIELLTGLVFLALAVVYGPTLVTIVLMAFAAALIAAAAIDFDHQIIPDRLSLGGLGVGLVVAPLARWFDGVVYTDALLHSLVGAALGGGLLWAVGFVHARISVAVGREFEHWPGEGEDLPRPGSLDYWTWFPGLGFGDVKLLAMIGAFVGPRGVLETILVSAVVGLALGLAFAVVRRDAASPFGFGPAIAAGALLVLVAPFPLLPAL